MLHLFVNFHKITFFYLNLFSFKTLLIKKSEFYINTTSCAKIVRVDNCVTFCHKMKNFYEIATYNTSAL